MIITLLLSLIFIASIILMLYSAVALVQKKAFFSSAPKDIQEKIIERKESRFKGARAIGRVLFLISLLAAVGAFIYGAYDGIRNNYTFWEFFARFLIMLYLYKAFDIVCFDWFLLTKTHFYQHYYPETEGCEGYKNFGFNKKSQIAKLIIFPFISALVALLCMLIK